jgi:hypothetical protein
MPCWIEFEIESGIVSGVGEEGTVALQYEGQAEDGECGEECKYKAGLVECRALPPSKAAVAAGTRACLNAVARAVPANPAGVLRLLLR